jgi:hypothetical protein
MFLSIIAKFIVKLTGGGSDKDVTRFFRSAFLTSARVAEVVVKINEEVSELIKRAEEAQSQAQKQLEEAEAEMLKIRDKTLDVVVRDIAKANVIKAAGLVVQARELLTAIMNDNGTLWAMLNTNKYFGGLEPPQQEQMELASSLNKVIDTARIKINAAGAQARKLVVEARWGLKS